MNTAQLITNYREVRKRLMGNIPPPESVAVEEQQPEPEIERQEFVSRVIVPKAIPGRLVSFHIRDVVCFYYGYRPDQFLQANRREPFCTHRQMAMYLCLKRTKLSLQNIGKAFRGRDHTTIINARRKIQKLIDNGDQQIIYDIERIEELL
jgi:chromosomal replication initiator protein